MRTLAYALGSLGLLLTVLVSSISPAAAAHFGNSMATITGSADADATGQAVVNYADGHDSFNSRITVRNLEPGESYTFLVRNAAGVERVVCMDEASAQGTFTCSEQDLFADGFGLAIAVVRDSGGTEVAGGVFERRGNCREPNQAGSQCDAPGQSMSARPAWLQMPGFGHNQD
jgi:hypothetical protein